jgi:hypothetical protein
MDSTENQRPFEGEARKVAQAKGTGREQRDKQAITMNDSTGAGSTLMFRSRYQPETEVKQLSCRNQSVALWPSWSMPRPDRRTHSVDPRPIAMGIHRQGHRSKLLQATE